MTAAAVPAVPLSVAAARLGITPQRVSQLLAEGRLEGPPVTGKRASPNVPRVWEVSLAAYEASRRSTGPTLEEISKRLTDLEARVPVFEPTSTGTPEHGVLLNELYAARAAASEFKVVAEMAVDARRVVERLNTTLAARVAALEAENRDLREQLQQALDLGSSRVEDRYRGAVTQLLGPGDVAEVSFS